MPILFSDLMSKYPITPDERAEGYAAEGGNMPLFHALLLIEQIDKLPDVFLRRDYLRLMVDLSEYEFDRALEICERRAWLYLIGDDTPEPLH